MSSHRGQEDTRKQPEVTDLSKPGILARAVRLTRPQPTDIAVDLGTGTGNTAIALAPKVKLVVAVDDNRETLSEFRASLAAIARGEALVDNKLYKVLNSLSERDLYGAAEFEEFKRSPLDRLQIEEADVLDWLRCRETSSVDIVTCRAALHHFAHPQDVLVEVRRVLKPDGRFEMLEPMFSEHARDIWSAISRMKESDYQSYYTYQEYMEMFERAGLEIESLVPFRFERIFEEWFKTAQDPLRSKLQEALRKLPDAVRRELKMEIGPDGTVTRWWYNGFELLARESAYRSK